MFVLVCLRTYTRSRLVNALLLLCASVCGRCPHIRPQKHAKVRKFIYLSKSFSQNQLCLIWLFHFLHLHVANRYSYVRVQIVQIISLLATCISLAREIWVRCTKKALSFLKTFLRCRRDSNSRPPAWQADILTNWTTAPRRNNLCYRFACANKALRCFSSPICNTCVFQIGIQRSVRCVGVYGFEPQTLCL